MARDVETLDWRSPNEVNTGPARVVEVASDVENSTVLIRVGSGGRILAVDDVAWSDLLAAVVVGEFDDMIKDGR